MEKLLTNLLNVAAGVAGVSSAAQAVPVGVQFKTLDIYLAVTAATGGTAPTVQVEVQWSYDGSTWFSADPTKDQTTALAVAVSGAKEFEVKAAYWRVVTTFGGAPTNMTYRVDYDYTP